MLYIILNDHIGVRVPLSLFKAIAKFSEYDRSYDLSDDRSIMLQPKPDKHEIDCYFGERGKQVTHYSLRHRKKAFYLVCVAVVSEDPDNNDFVASIEAKRLQEELDKLEEILLNK